MIADQPEDLPRDDPMVAANPALKKLRKLSVQAHKTLIPNFQVVAFV